MTHLLSASEPDLAHYWDNQGPLAQAFTQFSRRAQQEAYAVLVDRCLASGDTLAIEAAAGTGKTFAYLLPLLLRQQPAIISTASHHLQQQLAQRDLPALQQALATQQRVAVLKGRSQYLCPYYFAIRRANSTLEQAVANQAEQLQQRFDSQGDGDLSALAVPDSVLAIARCHEGECLASACPEYLRCPYFIAKRRAERADIVVLNHHLLLELSGAELFNDVSGKPRAVIIDEAHRLWDIDHAAATVMLSSKTLLAFIRDAKAIVARDAPEQSEVTAYLQRIQRAVKKLSQLCHVPRDNDEQMAQQALQQFEQAFLTLQGWLQRYQSRSRDLNLIAARHTVLLQLLQRLQQPGLLSLQPRVSGFLLYQLPVTVMEAMAAWLAQHQGRPLLLTSSTLSLPNQRQSLMQQLGLPEQHFYRLQQEHQWQQQALLYLPDLPVMPNEEGYAELLVASVIDFLAVTQGRILMLFSSYRALGEVAELLERSCQRPLLVQGDSAEPELVKQFIATPGALLLGTGSFWEGVDLAQAQLAAVIIDKLPFASPADPKVAVRSRHLQSQGVDAFLHYQLPQAALKLKQGVGRLLRREGDKGVIMLADPRIQSRPYGQYFLAALPGMPKTESLAEVAAFYTDITSNHTSAAGV